MICLLQNAPDRILAMLVEQMRRECLAGISEDCRASNYHPKRLVRSRSTSSILRFLLRIKNMTNPSSRSADCILSRICCFDSGDFFDVSEHVESLLLNFLTIVSTFCTQNVRICSSILDIAGSSLPNGIFHQLR